MGEVSTADALKHADAVFIGKVVAIEDEANDRIHKLPQEEQIAAWRKALDVYRAAGSIWGPHWGRRVTFEVAKSWKGPTTDTIEVWTGQGGGDCGLNVGEDVSYVVFARSSNGLLQASACSLTKALPCAKELLSELGEEDAGAATKDEIYPLRDLFCIRPPLLIGERGFDPELLRHTAVNLIVDAEGNVREFAFADEDDADPAIAKRIRAWKFRPATLDGKPVAVRIQSISARAPKTESEAKEKK